jgi:hypothetical protein
VYPLRTEVDENYGGSIYLLSLVMASRQFLLSRFQRHLITGQSGALPGWSYAKVRLFAASGVASMVTMTAPGETAEDVAMVGTGNRRYEERLACRFA